MTDIVEKTERYEQLLSEALSEADVASPADSPLGEAAEECLEMAAAYLDDGRHFREKMI